MYLQPIPTVQTAVILIIIEYYTIIPLLIYIFYLPVLRTSDFLIHLSI